MGEPAYVARCFSALAGRGVRVRALTYARPEAHGAVQAYAFGPAAGGARSLVVVVHATGNDALFPNLGLIEALVAQGHAVFAFDLDGHGRRSSTMLSLNAASGAVAAAVVAAAADPELAPAADRALHIVGQSLGGALALAAAAAGAAARARTLAVVAAPLRLAVDARAALVELLTIGRPGLGAETRRYGAWGLVPAFGRFKRDTYPIRLAPDAPRDYVLAVARLIEALDLPRTAARVAMPALLIYGTRDRLARAGDGALLQSALPRAQLALVRGATHFSTLFEPGVVDRITALIDAHTPGAAP